MSIQANINQTISIASMLATQSSWFQEGTEKSKALKGIKREEKGLALREKAATENLNKETEAIMKASGGDPEIAAEFYEQSPYQEVLKDIRSEKADVVERRFAVDPTPEGAQELVKARLQDVGVGNYTGQMAQPDEPMMGDPVENRGPEMRQRADANLKIEQDTKRETRKRTGVKYSSRGATVSWR